MQGHVVVNGEKMLYPVSIPTYHFHMFLLLLRRTCLFDKFTGFEIVDDSDDDDNESYDSDEEEEDEDEDEGSQEKKAELVNYSEIKGEMHGDDEGSEDERYNQMTSGWPWRFRDPKAIKKSSTTMLPATITEKAICNPNQSKHAM